ncbi:MAG: adenylate/guanylate cyclase domain-containing protein [Bacteroidota bacterium]
MLSPRNKRTLLQVLPFGIVSFIFSSTYSIVEKGILGNHPYYPSTGNPYNFIIFVPAVSAMVIGLFIGVFEVFYLNRWFRKSSFFRKIFFKTVVYLLLTTIAIFTIFVVSNAFELKTNLFDDQIWENGVKFFTDFAFWSIVLYFILGVIICLFYTEVSDYIGQSVLLNFFTGKYHRPIEERRIFMFLDMRSSTSIAEQLGHVSYFRMLKEYYVDLSEPIMRWGGEIYQYVGDEVIISWKVKKGLANNNCFRCFFAMQDHLGQQAQKYQAEFGVVPSFKAGIHLGEVTTGEIGVIKKEITFSGDVLNTTARIQGLCNEYQIDLLVSEELTEVLHFGEAFQKRGLGEASLRGRSEKINLYTIEKRG